MNSTPTHRSDLRTEGSGVDHVRSQSSDRLMAVIRIVVGLMWLSNINWKTPPNFGSDTGGGLYGYTNDAITHPVFAPYSWVVKHAVLPNFHLFGWMVLLVECALAAFLLLGLGTRFWGVIGAIQALAIGLSVALTPGEWPWSYVLMILANLSLVATAAGRTWGLDGVIRPLLVDRPGLLGRLVKVTT